MITLRQLKIDAAATLGDALFAVRAMPTYVYADGAPTTQRDGTRYTVGFYRLWHGNGDRKGTWPANRVHGR